MIRLLKRRGEHRQAEAIRDVLMQASKRYSLFVDGPNELTDEEEWDPSAEPKSRGHQFSGYWKHLHASVILLTMLTCLLALTLLIFFFAKYPADPTVAVISLIASLVLTMVLWRFWH